MIDIIVIQIIMVRSISYYSDGKRQKFNEKRFDFIILMHYSRSRVLASDIGSELYYKFTVRLKCHNLLPIENVFSYYLFSFAIISECGRREDRE